MAFYRALHERRPSIDDGFVFWKYRIAVRRYFLNPPNDMRADLPCAPGAANLSYEFRRGLFGTLGLWKGSGGKSDRWNEIFMRSSSAGRQAVRPLLR
jgi:hypothetical protein